MARRLDSALALATLCLTLVPAPRALAQASLITGLGGTAGYGPDGQCLSRNDDGSSSAIDIRRFFSGGLRFFTRTHTTLYLNTNGNVTFGDAVAEYTPESFPISDQPMIAPFWADVDIREYPFGGSCTEECSGGFFEPSVCEPCHNPVENGVWWYGETGRMIFTWDRVGHFACEMDERASFQLVLTEVEGCAGAGDFDVEFRYERCEWEVGSASGDSDGDGLCTSADTRCIPAQAGFDAGDDVNYVAIAGSLMPGIHTRLCTMSNVGEPGVWRFQIRSGTVVCPDAGETCSTGMPGVCATGRTNCVGMGTACVPDVGASAERCDALDNDCDGSADEDPGTLCPAGETCVSGTCLAPCFELGCPSGQVCTTSGRCIDEGCEEVSCPEGERCRAGACVGACTGVTCPAGQSCRGGTCVDLCEGLACDDCTVCEEGTCVTRCQLASCAAGETCLADGRCVEPACAAVSCGAGSVCRAGACVDVCEGAVCPDGQECRMGACMARRPPDAGTPPPIDAGAQDAGPPPIDSGAIPAMDAGMADAAREGPSPRGVQCVCRGAGRGQRGRGAMLAGLLLGLTWIGRRRGR